MKTKLRIGGLDCLLSPRKDTSDIAYVLYPMDVLDDWIEGASERYAASIAVITGMDWDNVFSPWPAPGEPPGSPAFRGLAQQFLDTLRQTVVPDIESRLSVGHSARRTLVGVSMSGLFSLWQWMKCDTFTNIVSLSGSFWFPGFVDWMKSQPVPSKTGKGYFLLGNQESKSPVKAFESVARDTAEILQLLKGAGVNVEFQCVPGNHFSDPVPRLDKGFAAIYS